MAQRPTRRVFYGSLVHATSLRHIQACPRALIGVSDDGVIDWVLDDVDSASIQDAMISKGWQIEDVDFIELGFGQWIMPGFVDTHTHAPQYPNMGIGGQYELLDWLKNVTFPTEAKFEDVEYAKKAYTSVVQRVLDCGTTTCCYYATLHLQATRVLADICHAKGQRAFIGKCNMDRHASETYQESSPAQSLADTETIISYIGSLEDPLVQPILTPRFAIACCDDLLAGLGTIASQHPDMAIQTHISENPSEIAFTGELFPDCDTYAHVYDKFGLLREKTILAHGVHLKDDELDLIKSRNAGISHCPTSNFHLSSGIANVADMLDRGIKVGLGTDVSGGYSPSILTAIQHASIASKVLAFQASSPPDSSPSSFSQKQLPLSALLYLATLGGADLCGLSSVIGTITPGKQFDAILVDVTKGGVEGIWVEQEVGEELGVQNKARLLEMLEKFLFCGDSRNVRTVWVKGRVVGGAQKP
ncbi:hypothetical protein M407DRAFT_243264 [Tulasnella calospora MUT 4182]|uniref:Guanine deaminase n=1 Tax=Tulasnella calospora MUT 4182 TaxID=1051891 RepID=A0A0C3QBF3_9AGAM|nr:hypothetical protein M407DRAFT_243264 [Tulasnella calospora MUT 4182]